MSLTLDAATQSATQRAITEPLFLVEMGFTSLIRFSTRETYSWDGFSWLAAGVELQRPKSDRPVIEVFNESTLFGQTVLTEGTAGRTLRIWLAYGKAAGGYTDPIMIFTGEMGRASIGEYINIQCKRHAPAKSPRFYVNPPTFNHAPKQGQRIETPNGTIVLERN